MFKKTQLYFSFQQISSSKIMLFFPRDPAKKTCSPNMNLVQTNIPDHANILQMLMWNQWKTLKIPWNFLLLNGCGWTYMILTYVTLLQTHSDSRQTPPGNPTCCFFSCAVFLHCSEIQVQFGVLIQFLIRTPPSVVCVHANYPTFWMT